MKNNNRNSLEAIHNSQIENSDRNELNEIITKKLNQDQKKKVKTDFDYSSNCCPKNYKKKLKH